MTTTKPKRANTELDLSDLLKRKKSFDIINEKPLAMMYDVYIVGEIEEPENYLEVFDKIRNAGELDVIKLHLNTPGGYLSTAIQFWRVLHETSAKVVASIEGECMSAGTILMLGAQAFEISDHSLIMVHHFSSGTYGKGQELRDRAAAEATWSNKMFREIYKDFLTEDELDKMLDGKDFWLSADETLTRLQNKARISKMNAAAEDDVKEDESE